MKTLLLGASTKPERYAYRALHELRKHGHEVVALGNYSGRVADVDLQIRWPTATDFDTVTLYLSPENQKIYQEKIVLLKPKRVIFNPGSENPSFAHLLRANGIEVEEACTLVLLATGQY